MLMCVEYKERNGDCQLFDEIHCVEHPSNGYNG